jgi:hypothetical protein
LVDLVTVAGGPLPPRAEVRPADLEEGIAGPGVRVEPGDAVLIRTGWWVSRSSAAGRSTFLLAFAPLPQVGSTGSPVTPVAVL